MRLALFTLACASLCLPPWAAADDQADLFKRLDANGDGFVASDEVGEEQKRLYQRLLRSSDKDQDGKLSREEFAQGTKPQVSEQRPEGQRGLGGQGPGPGPEQLFKRLDVNGDGALSQEETSEPLRGNFARVDANSDGKVSLEEFRAVAARFMAPQGGPQDFARMFDRMDGNGDGKLSASEIPEERREFFKQMLSRLDDDGDEAVTKEQFVNAMARMSGGARPETSPVVGPFALMRALDADGDGEISKTEIEDAAKNLARLDRNSDGKITREELGPPPGFGGRPGEGAFDRQSFVRNMLSRNDADKDGKLSKEEVPEFLQRNFDHIDADSDGSISEEELKAMGERLGRPQERPRNRPEQDN